MSLESQFGGVFPERLNNGFGTISADFAATSALKPDGRFSMTAGQVKVRIGEGPDLSFLDEQPRSRPVPTLGELALKYPDPDNLPPAISRFGTTISLGDAADINDRFAVLRLKVCEDI